MFESDFEPTRFEAGPESADSFFQEFDLRSDTGQEGPFSEEEEFDLATQLLAVGNEAELEQFLGSVLKKAWSGIKTGASAVGKIARPLVSVLKPLAKQALPLVGGALGSLTPVPGIGTALGTALGKKLGDALEMETVGMPADEVEFEKARRFVRIAGHAAREAARARPSADPMRLTRYVIERSIRQHLPGVCAGNHAAPALGQRGRWVRRGKAIILLPA